MTDAERHLWAKLRLDQLKGSNTAPTGEHMISLVLACGRLGLTNAKERISELAYSEDIDLSLASTLALSRLKEPPSAYSSVWRRLPVDDALVSELFLAQKDISEMEAHPSHGALTDLEHLLKIDRPYEAKAAANRLARDPLNEAVFCTLISAKEAQPESKVLPIWLEYYAHMMDVDAVSFYTKKWPGLSRNTPAAVGILNGLTSFGVANLLNTKISSRVCELLSERACDAGLAPVVRERSARGLGELGIWNDGIERAFTGLLNDGGVNSSSVWWAISQFSASREQKPLAELIESHCDLCLSDNDDETHRRTRDVFIRAASSFSEHLSPAAAEKFLKFYPNDDPKAALALIKILSRSHCAPALPILSERLKRTPSFIERMALVSALYYLHDLGTLPILWPYLHDANAMLRGRAIHSFCQILNSGVHTEWKLKFLDELASTANEPWILRKALLSLNVEDVPYEKGKPALEKLYKMTNDEEAIVRLDELEAKLKRPELDLSKIEELPANQQLLNQSISTRLEKFSSLPHDIQTILRCAEIPFVFSDLYQNNVDYSHVVIQYVKAAEVLLKELVGPRFVYPQIRNGLSKFQNMLTFIGLNRHNFDAGELEKLLGIEGKVSIVKDGLYAKFQQLSWFILKGKSGTVPLSYFDGLKSWAVFILMFSRKLSIHGMKIKPSLELPIMDPDWLMGLCSDMIRIQNVRNPFVHDQILLQPGTFDLNEFRKGCYELLNRLARITL